MPPMILMASGLTPVGLFTVPMMLLFTYFWVNKDWWLRFILILTALAWWNVHVTLAARFFKPVHHLSWLSHL